MSPAHELGTLLDALRTLTGDAQPDAALATLTATRGSTFRHAGTRMLVYGDGRVVCELSGGCPQHDIVLRAQRAIAAGRVERVRYNADSGLDVLMEMGCGGELEVLIEPLAGSRSGAFFEALARCLDARRSALAATLFALDGEVVPPRSALWDTDGLRFDDIGDPALLAAIADAAAEAPAATRAASWRLPAAKGIADVLIERIAPPHALVAIGSGATARALLAIGRALGWRTTMVDTDAQRLAAAALPPATHSVCANPSTLRTTLALDRYSSVVVMTHNLAQDMAWLAALHDAPLAYLGALGSRERVLRLRDDGALANIDLHAPAGLDLGAETPAEIALAIAAEIMTVQNGRDGAPLRAPLRDRRRALQR